MGKEKQTYIEIAEEVLGKTHNSLVRMLVRMWELEQGEYLCIGWRENMKDGYDMYKTQFILKEHARVKKEVK
jgi:hypothetical protein